MYAQFYRFISLFIIAINILIKLGKIYLKSQFTTYLFLAHFCKMDNW